MFLFFFAPPYCRRRFFFFSISAFWRVKSCLQDKCVLSRPTAAGAFSFLNKRVLDYKIAFWTQIALFLCRPSAAGAFCFSISAFLCHPTVCFSIGAFLTHQITFWTQIALFLSRPTAAGTFFFVNKGVLELKSFLRTNCAFFMPPYCRRRFLFSQ